MRRVLPSPFRCALRAALLALAAFSCGGSGASGAGGESGSAAGNRAGEAPSQPGENERKLRAAQESAVEAMCERLVECAVESARANMSPEEVAKLDVEETAPRLRDECEEETGRRSLSPRQVRVVQRCVTEAGTCDELHTCLDQAKKRAD